MVWTGDTSLQMGTVYVPGGRIPVPGRVNRPRKYEMSPAVRMGDDASVSAIGGGRSRGAAFYVVQASEEIEFAMLIRLLSTGVSRTYPRMVIEMNCPCPHW